VLGPVGDCLHCILLSFYVCLYVLLLDFCGVSRFGLRSCLHGVGVFLQKWFSQSCLFEMMKIFHFWKADPNEFKFGRYPDSAGFGSVYMVWACVCVRVCVCGKSGFLDGVAFFG
jgi:hypothetical protein